MKMTQFERIQNRNVVNELDLCIYNYVPVFHLMEVIKIVADRSRWFTKKNCWFVTDQWLVTFSAWKIEKASKWWKNWEKKSVS